ncbi:MAG: (d)CMP kinase [Phycisphaerales bacterium]|nr:(d)CMP kinase [Phycisphaerales bacterium]
MSAAKSITPVVITIDGPAGTGKSTVAHRLAERLGLEFLDTGAMYRAVTLVAMRNDIDPSNGDAVANAARICDLHFDWTANPPRIMIGHDDVSERIRGADVNRLVSIIAAQPAVRQVLVDLQRKIAQRHPRLVTEGRDQGSVVFPDAPVRFFLHAKVEVRADRRASQMLDAGQDVVRSELIEEIRRRDHLDSTRADGPLRRPDGAIDVDTGTLSIDEVVDVLEREVRDRLPDLGSDV